MTMQQQPIPAPVMPRLDPQNPYQMYGYFTSWLYALEDPKVIAESDKEIADSVVEFTEIALSEGMKAMGMRRGNPTERFAAYVRKYNWPLQIDAETGMLLHPVMMQQPVYDPQTGQPTGQMQAVPSDVGEDLWLGQQQKFPRQFEIDAKDAVKLGAPVPVWVLEYVQALDGGGDTDERPHEREPLRMEDPGMMQAPALQPLGVG